MEPSIKKMAEEFPNVHIHSVNVDDEPELCKKYKIMSVPTVILVLSGQEVNRITGAVLIEPLRKAFRDFINTQHAA
jgi:thioredoxin 1